MTSSISRGRVVVLSGNVGVGKTTIGPYLGRALSAPWMSESEISGLFPHLFAEESKSARIVAQAAFSTLRVASTASKVLDDRFQSNVASC